MSVPQNTSQNARQADEVDRFDEAQPFLQLLADMLNRMTGEPEVDEPEEEMIEPEHTAE